MNKHISKTDSDMSKATILLVEDERFYCSLLNDILQEEHEVIIAKNGLQALETLNKTQVDLVLLDIMLPDIDGYEVCQKIKATDFLNNIPIIFLTVKSDPDDELKGLNLGAVDYIIKPLSPPIVKARVAMHIALVKANQKIQHYAQELEQLVAQRTAELSREIAEKQKAFDELNYLTNYDQLTHLPNRNLFNDRLLYTYKVVKRNKSAFSLLVVDLDQFKQINDDYGQQVGDLLIKKVGARLMECLRDADTVARLGGDEFAVTLTEVHNKEDAGIVADKIITAFSLPFIVEGLTIPIGLNIGITSYPADGENVDNMLTQAEIAVYAAKQKGKNNFVLFSADMKVPVSDIPD